MTNHPWLGAVALLLCGFATAAESGEFDDRYYLSGAVGGIASGSDDLDTGPFGSLTFGKGISPFLGLDSPHRPARPRAAPLWFAPVHRTEPPPCPSPNASPPCSRPSS